MRGYAVIIGILAVMVAIFGGIFWAAGAKERDGWRLCDDAIMASLKAPQTYKRIDGPDTFAAGDTHFRIAYDADNSFGVPLRSHGFCTINESRTGADWVEMPS